MAAVATQPAPGMPRSRFYMDTGSMSTIRDPRSPNDEFPSPHSGSSTPHPDLNLEVESLSNKLISAINHQTSLDDALNATRQELDTTQDQVKRLEAENLEHERLISVGEVLKKADVDAQAAGIVATLAEEKRLRAVAEKEKKSIEQELENLTTALFEEANQMVSAARKETEASEHRNEQLRLQLKETQSLLASQQEQLAELKSVMQHMNAARDEQDAVTGSTTSPSTPGIPSQADLGREIEGIHIASNGSLEDVSPAPPTTFTNLLSPVLRTDLTNYEDFRALIDIPKRSAPTSRVNSGSYSGAHIPGLFPSSQSSNGSTRPSGGSSSSSNSTTTSPTLIPLKETRFYKRALTEDIEPTLRLDTAPGLSWLVRRSVINSMGEGSLVVEPMPASTKMFVFSCSLCGEHRKGEEFRRTHRFRTSESETAQRYPLCAYCLNRVRATCEYLSFLRMLKDGHWRTDGPVGEKVAWEESVRLRESMFWARIGGGVVPNFTRTHDSPRVSHEEYKPPTPYSAPPPMMPRGPPTGSVATAKENEKPVRADFSDAAEDSRDLKTIQESTNRANGVLSSTPDHKSSDAPSHQLNGDLQDSLNKDLLRSLAPKPRSKAASNELERAQSQERSKRAPSISSAARRSITPSPSPSNRRTSDQGLQISIPGGFDF